MTTQEQNILIKKLEQEIRKEPASTKYDLGFNTGLKQAIAIIKLNK